MKELQHWLELKRIKIGVGGLQAVYEIGEPPRYTGMGYRATKISRRPEFSASKKVDRRFLRLFNQLELVLRYPAVPFGEHNLLVQPTSAGFGCISGHPDLRRRSLEPDATLSLHLLLAFVITFLKRVNRPNRS